MRKKTAAYLAATLFSGLLTVDATADVIRGRVKAVDHEAGLVSLMADRGRVVLVSWGDSTRWHGVSNAGDIRPDELITVEVGGKGDAPVAVTVTRGMTPVPSGMPVITVDQLAEGLAKKELTLVDTRTPEVFDAAHIPGALSLPVSRIEKKAFGLLPGKNAKLVFYDEGQGGESAGRGCELARSAGYSAVLLFPAGASGWELSGRALASSTAFIRKIKPAVLDVRSRELAIAGHIEGAANFPAPALKASLSQLPQDKFAPVVVYGTSDNEAEEAARMVSSLGFRRVTIYPGGIKTWQEHAEPLASGLPNEKSLVSAQSHGGRLTVRDFEMALKSPVMVEIVDVRSSTDQIKGSFSQAKLIPLKLLTKKMGELDRQKIQVIFGTDQTQAEMAYDLLKPAGYRVNYFSGSVTFGNDGAYTLKGP